MFVAICNQDPSKNAFLNARKIKQSKNHRWFKIL